MADRNGKKKQQIKLPTQMRNYAKWDLLELNKRCCFFLTNYICLMQNESNCCAAHQAKQIIMKNGDA